MEREKRNKIIDQVTEKQETATTHCTWTDRNDHLGGVWDSPRQSIAGTGQRRASVKDRSKGKKRERVNCIATEGVQQRSSRQVKVVLLLQHP